MGNSAKRDARKADRAELARKALELRKAGANHDQIADQLKLANRSVSWKLVRSALRDVIREPANAVLQLELARLDALLLGCWQKAKAGDPHAIDRALRIMDRRSSYLGLDQPKGLKVEMARELESFLNKVRGAVGDDVYERLLAIAAGVDGPAEAGRDESGEVPADEEDDPGGSPG